MLRVNILQTITRQAALKYWNVRSVLTEAPDLMAVATDKFDETLRQERQNCGSLDFGSCLFQGR